MDGEERTAFDSLIARAKGRGDGVLLDLFEETLASNGRETSKAAVRLRSPRKQNSLFSVELCAGAGGQALGLEGAGFEHECLVEIDGDACATLRMNRPQWRVQNADLHNFDGRPFKGIDLLAGGLPCPPFSVAGKKLGERDERNLFPAALRLVDEMRPKALLIENVRGILDPTFASYRALILTRLASLGYAARWRLFNSSDFGVPQLRPRAILVAIAVDRSDRFSWPPAAQNPAPTVGDALFDLMANNGWRGANSWRTRANGIAPTIVGGSKKHGGPDLGPTRAKRAWAELGVDGLGIADHPPEADFVGLPRLTVRMVARLQGFPDSWSFSGRKTAAYRQVGNAFPPPVAHAVANEIRACIVRNSKT
ncbi:MAG: DNA cytosine methyltransferase [Gemmataceae bacterium]|nr:DNA cytosine methyltransferase [Gemmataceae bacterium]